MNKSLLHYLDAKPSVPFIFVGKVAAKVLSGGIKDKFGKWFFYWWVNCEVGKRRALWQESNEVGIESGLRFCGNN